MKENKPLVTVITAVYKKYDHLYETIKSVCKQNYPYIEYIICDDASGDFPKDEIETKISSYNNRNLDYKIIENDTNLGTVKNINNAIKNAKGDYIFPLSCGDVFFDETVVQRIVNVFMEKHSEVVVTSRLAYKNNFECLYFMPHFKEREVLMALDTQLKQYKSFILSEFRDMASGSAMYYSKHILEIMGYFDEGYVLWEDGPFLAKYLWTHKLCCAYEIISIWYEREGVSSVSVDGASPLMRADVKHYVENEWNNHLEIFSLNEIHRIRYRQERCLCNTWLQRRMINLRYLPEMIYYIRFSKKRDKLISDDLIRIQNMKINKPER